jgi:hypothetical protein
MQNAFKEEALTWLLEPDTPCARYLALRDLCDLAEDDPELLAARKTAHEKGAIATILATMNPAGYWETPGPGYRPKYRSTVWSVIMLAQLGASIQEDERISKGCTYILDHALAKGGRFSTTGAPSGTADCLQGNLCWALVELGIDDPRLEAAFEWMARSVTGEGVSPKEDKKAKVRYYAGKCGPNFACGSNNKLPCAWGAVKVMLAFSKLPPDRRTPLIDDAIQQGIDFLFGTDPAKSDYPTGFSNKPSRNWWKFGFPVFYVTDILQNVEALIGLGYGSDPRLENALALIREKQDQGGRWALEYDYTGKTWVEFGVKKQPNKWVTLRALKALKAVGLKVPLTVRRDRDKIFTANHRKSS